MESGEKARRLGGLAGVEKRERQVIAAFPGRIERGDALKTVHSRAIETVLAQKNGDRILLRGRELVGLLQALDTSHCVVHAAHANFRLDQFDGSIRVVVDQLAGVRGLFQRFRITVGGESQQHQIVVGEVVVGVQARSFAQLGLGEDVILGVQKIESQVLVWRCLRGVEVNRVAIVAGCLVEVAELGLGNPQQILYDGGAGRDAMRLLELDQRLIEAAFANERHPLLQRRGLRAKRQSQCGSEQRKHDQQATFHCFAPESMASSAGGAAFFSVLMALTWAKTWAACAVLPSARRTIPN